MAHLIDDNKHGKRSTHRKTAKQIQTVLGHTQNGLPIWVRAPVRGPEFYTGLTRPKLYQLDADGLIESRSITQPGKVRGCRLFNLASILSYINRGGEQ